MASESSQWLTQPAAAERLGTTVRTIQRLVSERKIGSQSQPVKGRKPIVLIDPQDIERILGERTRLAVPNGHAPQSLEVAHPVSQPEMLTALAERIHVLAQEWWPQPSRPFLNREQAAQFSGLPRNAILRLIRQKKLPALRFSGEWYVKRSDLEKLDL